MGSCSAAAPTPACSRGLYEPIGVEIGEKDDPKEALKVAFRQRLGCEVLRADWLGEVVHVFSHRRLRATVYWVEATGVIGCHDGYQEVALVEDPETVGLSTLARRILALQPQLELPLAAEGAYGESKRKSGA